MMKAQASSLVNLSDNVRRFLNQLVGQAFLPVALDSQGKRERLPYNC
jgi:hypothetical protein